MSAFFKKAFFILCVCLGPEAFGLSPCYEAVQNGAFQKIDRAEIRKIFSHPESYVKYKGQEGYLLFVKKTPNSNSMGYIFRLVSEALGEDFKKLGWQLYYNSAEEFEREKDRILNKNGRPIAEYVGQSGQALYAEKHYDGDMKRTFQNISAVLTKTDFKKLGWQMYQGLVDGFNSERGRILDKNGQPIAKYAGQSGLAQFAIDHYARNMFRAFINISASLDPAELKLLGWKVYVGSVDEFNSERGRILNKNGRPIAEYVGQSGQAQFAEKHYDGNMFKAFINISASLETEEFKLLGWKQYQGLADEFNRERGRILDKNGELVAEYVGQSGLAKFADAHYDGDMFKAFVNISASLDPAEFKLLGWKVYHGSVDEFNREIGRILDKNGELIEEYKGQSGQAQFAEKHYDGNMHRAFQNISASLDKEEFKKLGWRNYQGSVDEFNSERGRILDENGQPIAKYKGPSGQALFAEDYYDGNMFKTAVNVSAVLGGAQIMKNLGLDWKHFNGSAFEYDRLVQLFEENDWMELKGEEGLERVASEIFNGHRGRAYRNVSALRESLLGSWEAFKDLSWPVSARQ